MRGRDTIQSKRMKDIFEVMTESLPVVTSNPLQTGRVLTSLPLCGFGRRYQD